MIRILPALALLAFTPEAHAAAPAKAPATKSARKPAAPVKTAPEPPRDLSAAAARVSSWVNATGDNRGLAYVIVDKPSAAVFLFDGTGARIADGPALVGLALGDEATPGIGSKSLEKIGPAEKTTPAGRYYARFGKAAGGVKVLWVDYATSVALHTIPPATMADRRKRMLSPEIDDNRVTYGCINVPKAFYQAGVVPRFTKKGGYVYILPDEKPLEDVFPLLRAFHGVPPAAAPAQPVR
jgi:hypothetical protein